MRHLSTKLSTKAMSQRVNAICLNAKTSLESLSCLGGVYCVVYHFCSGMADMAFDFCFDRCIGNRF